ncbi:MAG: nitrate- and nitrite sensing domain-containing protein, partial [Sulfurimonas sp.]|nr:nitrate- and nitrite sensing domain-containing protein [Sulfurimonas sp.]
MKIVYLKDNIPKLLILPLIILLTYSVYSGLNKFEEKQELSRASKCMQFSIMSSSLIHELQKERGYSSSFASSKSEAFSDELKQQRSKTDREIQRLKIFIDNFNHYKSKLHFQQFSKNFLLSIDTYRINIDNHKLLTSEIMNYYTDYINILLNLNEQIISINRSKGLTHLVQSYITLMKAKEKAGIERALISRVLGEGKLLSDDFHIFEVLVSAQNIYITYFKSTAEQKHIDLLASKMATESFKKVTKIRNQIYVKHEKNEIVSQIRQLLGYGGLIHNFKNYIIRKTKNYATDAQDQYIQLLSAIDNYKAIKGVTAQEIKQLEVLEDTFAIYMQKLPKITKSFQDGLAISDLDKMVKVNDEMAVEALNNLNNNIYGSQSDWFKHSTKRINLLKEVEDQIAYDLNVLINKNNDNLSRELIIQAVILIIILIIILLSYIMLRELIESKKVLNRAQENTSSGSYEYYIEDNILLWSDEHYKLLQVDKEKFKPTMDTFMIFVHPDDVEIVNNSFELAKTSKEMVFFEYRL